MQGDHQHKHVEKNYNPTVKFFLGECALGGRLVFGLTTYLICLATFLVGYRQIMIANTIQSIVTQGSLLTEQVRKKSDQLQGILIFVLSIYFVMYVLGTCLVGGSPNVQVFISTFSAANSVFTLLGMSIYWHTIQMLRTSIHECAMFKFDSKGVYSIYALYCFIFVIQMAYLFSYQYVSNAIIVSTLIHLVSYFLVQLIVFIMLLRMGSGLKLVSHCLNDGEFQFEGYD